MRTCEWSLSLVFVSLAFGLQPVSALAERLLLVAGGGSNTNVTAPIKATEAKLGSPFGVDFDGAGYLYLVEMTGQRVRKLDKAGMLTVFAGTGEKSMKDGPGLTAQFNGIHNLARSGDDLLLADTWNNCIRGLNLASGMVRRVAGTSEKGFAGDGGPAAGTNRGGPS